MTTRKPFYRSLYLQVLIAIAFGILLGHFFPETGARMKPLGDGFIRLIKMIIAPIIFCTVVTGIAGMKDIKAVGRTGIFALLYFEVVSTFALVIGLIVINVARPGVGMNIDVTALDASQIDTYTKAAQQENIIDHVLNIIPNTVIDAFARGDILQVLLFALLFGFSLHALGSRGEPIFNFIAQLSHVFFGIVGIITRVAPIGAFGAMAFTIGKYGINALGSLAALMACFYGACLLFIFVVLGAIARVNGFSIWAFIKYIREELLIVLGTSSSESVLPRIMNRLEQLGCGRPVVGLVIPTGYSFNLDGTSIYLTMATVFIAQATNTPLGWTDQLLLLGLLLLTSKGATGVTGSGFIVLASTLSALGTLPVTALALILGIDRFMSEARALTNLVGNGVATIVVSRWVGALDKNQLHAQLAAGPLIPVLQQSGGAE
ncbi:MAG: Aerobic C4-dicarboxylate transporter for fumarate, L-malate, D-malate, succunate [Verrucomicrobiaceae bacterium]|nr:Aerobic C4-dicarboxylate transporter for fumarate, L-malate, D-malate, succunate [Verrucomicrobiaceae bacterium]